MSNLLNITLANIKRLLKRPLVLIMAVALPLGLIILMFSHDGGPGNSSPTPVAIVIESNGGEYETKLLEHLGYNASYYSLDYYDDAIKSLKQNEVTSVLVLDKNFSEDIKNSVKPTIKSVKTGKGGGALLVESQIENFINDSIKEINNIPTNNISVEIDRFEQVADPNIAMSIAFVGYFLLLTSTDICRDLLTLKKNKVLKRTLSTANSNITILGGIFLSTLLVYVILGALSVFAVHLLLDIPMSMYFNNFILISSMAFLALAFTVFVTRIFNNEILVMMSLVVLAIGTFIPGLLLFQEKLLGPVDPFFENIVKLTPFYWCIDGAYYQNLFPNVFVIVLIGLVLLTAGSFKLTKYVE